MKIAKSKYMLGPKQQYFLNATKKISSEQFRKVEKSKHLVTVELKKKNKKMPHFDHFPVLGNLTHKGHLLLDGGVVINKQEISDYFFYSSKP